MAVVISNGPTTISTANGFYRCESYNMNWLGGIGQVTASTTPQHLATTFANAGNLKGIGLLLGSVSAGNNRGVRINLAENLGTFTVSIASPAVITKVAHGLNDLDEVFLDTTGALPTGLTKKTVRYYVRNKTADTFNISTTPTGSLVNSSGTQSGTHSLLAVRNSELFTYDKILPPNVGANDSTYAYMIVPFEFTTPYAVDTTADKWRFIFYQEGGTTGTYYFGVSDGVISENFNYFAWCDNQLSFTNDDVLICKDRVTIDASFSIKGILGYGNTVYSNAGLICRSLSKNIDEIANLVWEENPSASYTMTIDGALILGSFSGFQIGSEANPIPASAKANIVFTAPSVGTNVSMIQTPYYYSTSRHIGKSAYIFYGEIPTKRVGFLASNALAGQNKIVLTEDMSADWQVGDELAIGKQLVRGQGSVATYTITSFNGTEITLNTNIASYTRYAGGTVLNLSRAYGIEFTSDNDARYHYIMNNIPVHERVSGCKFKNVSFLSVIYATTQYYEDASSTKSYICDNQHRATQTTSPYFVSKAVIGRLGGDLKRNYCFRSNFNYLLGALYIASFKSGLYNIEENISLCNYSFSAGYAASTNYRVIFKNNRWENSYYAMLYLFGKNSVIEGNTFWGGSSTHPSVRFGTFCLNPVFKNNYFDYNYYSLGYGAAGLVINGSSKNDNFGQEQANLNEFYITSAVLGDISIVNPKGVITLANQSLIPETTNGFKLRIANENQVANVDKVYLTEGYYVRCGTGLPDTTVHTDGGFSLRMEALNEPLLFEQYVPTGDITGKTMTVAVWVKLNSSNYWAGTNVMPRLTVDYDDGSIAYAEAGQTTDWQLLIVPITPITSYGRIKITLSIETDQSGSDAYVYWDDMSVLYPAGVQVSLGSFDIWANAEPITPSISTNLSPADVWNVQTSGLTGAGTTGKKLKDLENPKIVHDSGLVIY